jgi:hypothetical protein
MYVIENISYKEKNGINIKVIELYYSDIIIIIDDKITFFIMTNYHIMDYKKIKMTNVNTLNDCNKVLIENGYEELKKNNIRMSNCLTTYEHIYSKNSMSFDNPKYIETNKYVDEIKELLPEFIDAIFN